MIAALDRGFDIVCGWRKDRRDAFVSGRLPSMIANRLISWATGVRLHDYGCSLKVFRADIVKPLRLYGEMHRFLPAIASEQGVTIFETPVRHRARQHGRSNYGIGRTIRVILDLLTVKFLLSYSTRPLQIFGLIGVTMGLAGATILGWLAGIRVMGMLGLMPDQSIGNRPALLFGILLVFTGVQLVTLGLLAELQSRTYHESQRKPTYAIPDPTVAGRAGGERDVSSAGRDRWRRTCGDDLQPDQSLNVSDRIDQRHLQCRRRAQPQGRLLVRGDRDGAATDQRDAVRRVWRQHQRRRAGARPQGGRRSRTASRLCVQAEDAARQSVHRADDQRDR